MAITALGSSGFILTACGGGTSTTASTTKSGSQLVHLSAQQIMGRAVAAGMNAGSVHLAARLTQGKQSEVFTGDATAQTGRRVVTGPTDQKTTEIQVETTAYFLANQSALVTVLGFDSSLASQIANKWVAISQGEPNYVNLTGGLTLTSLLTQLPAPASLSKTGVVTIDGQEVVGLRSASTGGSSTIYVAATGEPFPVKMVATSKSSTQSVTLSRWGQPVTINAPPNAIQLSFR